MALNVMMKVVIDVLLLLAVAFPILLFFVLGEPYKRGFYCNDETLSYPYKDSTISNTALYIVGIFVPILVISVIEGFHTRRPLNVKKISMALPCKIPCQEFLVQLYLKIGPFLFGAACSQLTTDIAKYSIGRLRPHFFDVCAPNWENINCSALSKGGPAMYIVDYSCRGTDDKRLKEMRLSFLSGHASFSAYAMVYLVLYMQSRMTWKLTRLTRPFFQLLAILLSWFTALSRVIDNKHHWSDVLAGSIVGTTVAVLVALFVSDLFPKYSEKHGKNMKPLIETELTDTTDRSDGHRTPESSQNSAKSRYQGPQVQV